MRTHPVILLVAPIVGCTSPPPPISAPAPARITVPPARHTVASTTRAELEAAFSFEGSPPGSPPRHWTTRPDGTGVIDDSIVHGGHGAIRLERTATTPAAFSTIIDHIPIDFSGSSVELRGFIRTENVDGDTGLWLREDGANSVVQFTNMQDMKLHGTTGWTEYSVQLPLDTEATQLVWGVLLHGQGKAWADDLQLLVDGKPIWDAPYVEKVAPGPIHGSGISVARLSPVQIANLVALGRVWGFLKYHHPKITAGLVQWDDELLRVLPSILAASDRAAGDASLLRWIDDLGPVPPCRSCVTLDEHDLALRPDLAWLDDRAAIGAELSARLHAIYDARVPNQQFYVALAPGVGNPELKHEPAYAAVKLPDAGYQLLALFRLWNIVEYWAPDRTLADRWQAQLAQLVPTVMLAATAKDYQLAMMEAIARLRDSHANLWSSLDVRPPEGPCELAIDLRFVGRQPVVATADPDRKLEPGDVITSVDGAPIDDLVARWLPYYAGSNEASQLRDVALSMTRGPCGPVAIGVDRRGSALLRTLHRATPAARKAMVHDLAGPAFRLLSPDIAYLKLSSVDASAVAHYVEQAAGTKGWIIDIRNYPAEFVVFALGSLLVDKTTPFARFTTGDLSNPGAFHWTDNESLDPSTPHYAGKVVVLVDELSQSQAEYTAMALRASPRTVIVGSTTAGADGNVSPFSLPGGLSTMISGIGVFYPDRTPTQRVGIVPDVVVTPTIAGLRAGRDEVLEAAIREVLGKAAPAAEIERISKAARSGPK